MRQCLTCRHFTANPKFCSRSCAAATNNRFYPKRRPEGNCKHCRAPTSTRWVYCTRCRNRNRARPRFSKPSPVGDLPAARFALDVAGLTLWWAEGDKSYGRVGISNSDPSAILLAYRWLRDVYHVPRRKFRIELFIHDDLDPERTARFWSRFVGLPLSQFQKLQVLHGRRERTTKKLFFGVCQLRVCDVGLQNFLTSRLGFVKSLARSSQGVTGARIRRLRDGLGG